MRVISPILHKLSYEIELTTQILTVLAAGIIYGIIEAKWIPTHELDLPILGRFSYYHIGLLSLMFVVSFSLSLSHLHWMLKNRKRYVLYMSLGSLPLSLMIEDATWFVTRWQPIAENEWTMMSPGLGIDLGFTWIPLWYIITLIFSTTMFYLGSRSATRGYEEFKKHAGDQ